MVVRKSLNAYVAEASNAEVEKNIRMGMARFIEVMYGLEKPERRTAEYIDELNALSLQYLEEERDHVSDITQYLKYMAKEKYAPYTVRRSLSIVKVWFEWNDIIISPNKYRTLIKPKLPRARPIAKKNKDLTKEDLNRFFDLLPLDRQCILLVLISSGMRVGEVTSICLDDINWNTNPVEIHVREELTKTKTDRFTFISSEAARLIQSWLLVREDWILKTSKYGHGMGCSKDLDDDRVFPLHVGNVSRSFRRYLRVAGLYERDTRTGRSTIIPHLFRGYFLSQLQVAGMPGPVANLLAGHVAEYQGAYDIYSKDQIRQMYLDVEYAVSLSSNVDAQEVRDIQRSYINAKYENERMQDENERMRAQMAVLDERLKIVERLDRHKPNADIQKRADIR